MSILRIILISIYLFISLANAQTDKNYINLYPKDIDSKYTNKHLLRVDSLCQQFYSNTFPALISNNKSSSDWVKSMSNSELKEIAKILVFLFYIPSDEYMNFLVTINEPFHDQIRREQQAKKMGMSFNEIRAILPGALIHFFVKEIEDRLSWEWTFHLTTRYILIVEILDKRTGSLQRPEANYPLYECKVISDIKGNFNGNEYIGIIGGPNAKMLVETDNTYLVLLYSTHRIGMKETPNEYVTGGYATKGHGFFEIENGKLIDKYNLLHVSDSLLTIDSYKKNVQNFFDNMKKGMDKM